MFVSYLPKYLFSFLLLILISAPCSQGLASDWQQTGMHMRLVDDLDRPQDGWCLDAVGSGPNIRFDMPLIGHNCKPGLFADEAVIHRADGTLFFPAYNACVTAMGLNQHALPMASLMLKPCGYSVPFLESANFQYYTHTEDQMIQLKDTELCVVVGDESLSTFDETHRWRTLYLERCSAVDKSRAQWKFIKP
jgi:hypothetical protein